MGETMARPSEVAMPSSVAFTIYSHLFSIFIVGLSGADRDQFLLGWTAAAACCRWLRRLAVQATESIFSSVSGAGAPAFRSAGDAEVGDLLCTTSNPSRS